MKTSKKVQTKTQRKQTRDVPRQEHMQVVRSLHNVSNDLTVVTRKCTLVGTLATNASGYIAAVQYQTSGVTSCYDWSGMAGRYLEYRVKSLRVRLFPIVTQVGAASSGGGAVTPAPSGIVAADMHGSYGYVAYGALCAGANSEMYRTCSVIDRTVDWKSYPDAHLWTPSNSTIAAGESYGIQLQDSATAPAAAASTIYYRVYQEYLVEFRLTA